jgi:peptidoglycan/LPS O-acetylase OafA/YrhL
MLIFGWERTGAGVRCLAGATFFVACLCQSTTWTETMILLALLPLTKLMVHWRALRIPRPIVLLGFVSYPLYLIHQNVGVVLIRETAQLIPADSARILVATLVSLAVAAILSMTIEHRFRRPIELLLANALAGTARLSLRLRPAAAIEPHPASHEPRAGEGRP